MLYLNTAPNGIMAAPAGGYPIRLSALLDTAATGVMPIGKYSTATAVLKADTSATAHLGLFMPPVIAGSEDLGVIAQTDLVMSSGKQTMIVTLPATLPVVAQLGPGSISLSTASTTVTGTGTLFATDGTLNGYLIHVDGDNDASAKPLWYSIVSVASATSLTISVKPTNTVAGAWYLKPAYPQPPAVVVRLWVDGTAGRTADTVAHQAVAGYAVSQNPGVPNGVTLYSLALS